MPEPRKILAAAPPLAPDDPVQLVAFACSPEWVEANLPAAGADGQPAKPALPRFSMVAYTGGPMRLQGWRHPVIVDLAGLAIPTQNRPIRLGHDAAHGVGHTDSLRVEGGKLIASGLVSRDTAAAREVVISSKNGFRGRPRSAPRSRSTSSSARAQPPSSTAAPGRARSTSCADRAWARSASSTSAPTAIPAPWSPPTPRPPPPSIPETLL